MRCDRCGREIPERTKYCIYCGNRVIDDKLPEKQSNAKMPDSNVVIICVCLVILFLFILVICSESDRSIESTNVENNDTQSPDVPNQDSVIAEIKELYPEWDCWINSIDKMSDYEVDYEIGMAMNCKSYEKDQVLNVTAICDDNNRWDYNMEEATPTYKILVDLPGDYHCEASSVNWAPMGPYDEYYSLDFTIEENNEEYTIYDANRVYDDEEDPRSEEYSVEMDFSNAEEHTVSDVVNHEQVTYLELNFWPVDDVEDFGIGICFFPDGSTYCGSNTWYVMTKK